jgi:AcrR family transcriptional regulator
MTPRRYTLGRRADSAAATRQAILDAAMAVYLETGSAKAPLTAIAARADVSRGTILHHFGDAGGLIDAVIAVLPRSLALPDERILDGVEGTEARVRAYVGAMVAFFRRSTPWWYALQSEMDRPSAKAAEAAYWSGLAELQSNALGPALGSDQEVQQAMGALLHPGTMGTLLWVLEQAGVTAEEADRMVEDYVIGFLRLRHGKTVADTADRSILPNERGTGGEKW